MEKKIDFESMADDELSEDLLARLGDLARRQMDLEDQIAGVEEQLKGLNGKLLQVSGEDIPEILDETGLSEVRLTDGTKVIVKENLRVSVGKTSQYRAPVLSWLEREGHDDVIKDQVVALFGKGEGDKAEALLEAAKEFTPSVDRDRSVHSQTFAALLRELLADGEDVPLDELGVFVQRQTKLDRP